MESNPSLHHTTMNRLILLLLFTPCIAWAQPRPEPLSFPFDNAYLSENNLKKLVVLDGKDTLAFYEFDQSYNPLIDFDGKSADWYTLVVQHLIDKLEILRLR